MRVLTSGQRRSTIRQTVRGAIVSIPARRNLGMTIFFGFWMCGWPIGEVLGLASLLVGNDPIEAKFGWLMWLGVWTAGGVSIGITWAWITFGHTIVEVANGILIIRWKVLGIGVTRSYDVNKIMRLRPRIRINTWLWSRWPRGESPFAGTISFDYDAKTIDFGAGLDETETDIVIDELRDALRLTPSAVRGAN